MCFYRLEKLYTYQLHSNSYRHPTSISDCVDLGKCFWHLLDANRLHFLCIQIVAPVLIKDKEMQKYPNDMQENKMSASSDSSIFVSIILLTNCMCNLSLNLQNNSEVFMLPIANQTFFINIHALFPFVILFMHCKQWLMQLSLLFAAGKQQAV